MGAQLASSFLPLLVLAWLPTGTVSHPEEANITMECKFKTGSENFIVHVKWYKPAGLEVGNQTRATTLEGNTPNLTSPGLHAANMGICECTVFSTRINLTDTGNGMQGAHPSCGHEAPQTNVTKKEIWTDLSFLLCITFGLAVGTLLYMPVVGILLWQCRRTRKGKLTSRQELEGNQLSTAAAGTGMEELTYANLKFEKGTKPMSSDVVVYTEIKPPHRNLSGGAAGAARAGLDVSSEGEGK